jgi:hypothetical protein
MTQLKEAHRIILRLQNAAIAVEDWLTEDLGTKADSNGPVLMLRAAILEAERYFPVSQEEAERLIPERK